MFQFDYLIIIICTRLVVQYFKIKVGFIFLIFKS